MFNWFRRKRKVDILLQQKQIDYLFYLIIGALRLSNIKVKDLKKFVEQRGTNDLYLVKLLKKEEKGK